jgi:hypothetical protein
MLINWHKCSQFLINTILTGILHFFKLVSLVTASSCIALGSLDVTSTLVTIKATSTLAEDKILKAHLHWQILLVKHQWCHKVIMPPLLALAI